MLALGTYFYVIIGQVNDTYLKMVAPTMLLLSVLTTFVAGDKLGSRVSNQFGKERGQLGKNIGSIAALLLITVPSLVDYGFQTTNETMLTLFIALAFVFLTYSIENPSERGFFVCAGAALGGAYLTSYQELYFVIPVVFILAVKSLRNRISSLNSNFSRNCAILLGGLVTIGGASYVRNTLLLQYPVYPFFSQLFHARYLSGWLFDQTLSNWKYVAYSRP